MMFLKTYPEMNVGEYSPKDLRTVLTILEMKKHTLREFIDRMDAETLQIEEKHQFLSRDLSKVDDDIVTVADLVQRA